MANFSKVSERDRLKVRRDPYWAKIQKGCYLGFRKMTTSGGNWLLRAFDESSGKQVYRPLGDFLEIPDHQRYDAAKKEAEEWFKHLGRGGLVENINVGDACRRYVETIRDKKGSKAADDTDGRFIRYVFSADLAKIQMAKLARRHVEAWVKKLKVTPVNRGVNAKGLAPAERSPSSVNRDMTVLRAALNKAFNDDVVTTDAAWRVALTPIKNADRRRDAYLERGQRLALIEKAAPDVGLFLRGLASLPLRPGALAALSVADLDKRLKVLKIGKDKADNDRKILLPGGTFAFFLDQTKGKLPKAPLLSREDGGRWDKDAWKKPVKAAARAAGLAETITAYAMRHSVITDLVTGGLDLMTVAQLSGTSVVMIEKHYSHLRADHAAAALATLTL
jgi:integrase